MAFRTGRSGSLASVWASCVSNVFSGAASACAKVDDRPSICVEAYRLPLGRDGRLNISPLGDAAGPWPSLRDEWHAVASIPGSVIPLMPDDMCVALESLFWFVILRCKWCGAPLPRSHILKLLRAVTVDVTTWLVEVHVHLAIVDALGRKREPEPTVLVGAQGCRVHGCTWKRLQVLSRVVHSFGSDQVTVSALGHRRGDAAVMRRSRNRLYLELTRLELKDTWSVGVCWDGATHGGLDTIVGSITATSGRSFYLRPQAM